MCRTSYLRSVFDHEAFQKTVERTHKLAKKLRKAHHFDTVAFCGMSGSAMAFILADKLKLELLAVRKPGEASHYVREMNGFLIEGNTLAERYLLVDDFICSGNTISFMLKTIHNEVPKAQCVAMIMYATSSRETYTHPITEQLIPVIGAMP